MISRLHVENYKCLRDVTVDLGPFTVLIGSNDSGKSSILDAIRVIGRTASETIAESLLPEGERPDDVFDELVWDHDRDQNIALHVDGALGEQKLAYRVSIGTGCVVADEAFSVDGERVPKTSFAFSGPSSTQVTFQLRDIPAAGQELKALLSAFAWTERSAPAEVEAACPDGFAPFARELRASFG